jgi:butyrate kinase
MASQEIIIALNPGSTSTKIACYDADRKISGDTILHDQESLARYRSIWDQFSFRYQSAFEWVQRLNVKLSAVVGIGGLLRPVPAGTYYVNKAMLADARANKQGSHSSNLGCAMAYELAQWYNCPAFVVDPVSVDEFTALARYSGHPLIERKSLSHALNLHAMARRAARDVGKEYESSSFVVAHLGGGISVAPVLNGKIIDANDASSDGPFSPERTGGLPLQQFIGLCFEGGRGENEMRSLVMGKGGLVAYLGTNSLNDVEKRCTDGDLRAVEVLDAMAYQIAKEIGAMATVLGGKADAVVLTGGMASSVRLVSKVADRVRFIARILTYPGEDEMLALAEGALRVLRHQEQAKEY